jgi:hypothetical protein
VTAGISGIQAAIEPADYFFTFFGSQSFFFFDATTPHSLQRQSPGLALRIGFPF